MAQDKVYSQQYIDYHASPEWQVVRAKTMLRCKGICEICKERTAREVHIKNYPLDLFSVQPRQCLAVCRGCHKQADRERRRRK